MWMRRFLKSPRARSEAALQTGGHSVIIFQTLCTITSTSIISIINPNRALSCHPDWRSRVEGLPKRRKSKIVNLNPPILRVNSQDVKDYDVSPQHSRICSLNSSRPVL